MRVAVSSRFVQPAWLRSERRGEFLGHDQPAGLAHLRAEPAGCIVASLCAQLVLGARKHPGGVGSRILEIAWTLSVLRSAYSVTQHARRTTQQEPPCPNPSLLEQQHRNPARFSMANGTRSVTRPGTPSFCRSSSRRAEKPARASG